MTVTAENPKGRGLRIAVLAVAGIEVILLGGVLLLLSGQAFSSDPLSRGIARAVATLLAIPLVIFAVPALILGIVGRWLKLALMLAVLAVPVTAVLHTFM